MKAYTLSRAAASRRTRNVCIFCLHQLRPSLGKLEKAPLIQQAQSQQLRTITKSSRQGSPLTEAQLNSPGEQRREPPRGKPQSRAGEQPNNQSWAKLPRRPRQESSAQPQQLDGKASNSWPKTYNRSNWNQNQGSTQFVGFQKGTGRDGPREPWTGNPSARTAQTWRPAGAGRPDETRRPAETGHFRETRRPDEETRRGRNPPSVENMRGAPAVFEQETFETSQPDQAAERGWAKKGVRRNRVSDDWDQAAAPHRGGKGKQRDGPTRREQKFEQESAFETEEERLAREAKQQKRKERKVAVSIELPQFITVANLSTLLKVRQESFIEKLEELGFSHEETAPDHVLGFENASLIAMELNFEPMRDVSELEDLKARPQPEDRSLLPSRAPVVTIMGHVDHGKTTLLDYLRKSSVAASEHGGITQHIGAFSVPMSSGINVTFLDTPGHAAFLSMRQRGANVTDIVVLVVAADDSVKPQTIEAIKHAKAANVPIIVAINKIDKDGADIELVKKDLTRHEIVVEDFGGDIQAIPVSGKTGQGLDDLEEALVAQAETLDLRTAVDGTAEGWVIEAGTKANGRVATILVKRGTMRPGDVIVAGNAWARIRTLKNEAGVQVPEAGPGTPVEVDGWREQPTAGDEVLQAPTEQKAVSVVDYRLARLERVKAAVDIDAINASRRAEAERRELEKKLEYEAKTSGQDSSTKSAAETSRPQKEDGPTELCLIIKADVTGSAEAVQGSVMSLPLANQPVKISILRTGIGPVTESDIAHVGAVPAGRGIIVSFNQATPPTMMQLAEANGVHIMEENIIYNVVNSMQTVVEKHLPPRITQKVLGEAEAAAVFDINIRARKTVRIAGCKVRNGVLYKGKKVRVSRRGEVVYTGVVSSLKFHKKDVTEIGKGSECGIAFEKWEAFEVGDAIQCFEEISEPRRLT